MSPPKTKTRLLAERWGVHRNTAYRIAALNLPEDAQAILFNDSRHLAAVRRGEAVAFGRPKDRHK